MPDNTNDLDNEAVDEVLNDLYQSVEPPTFSEERRTITNPPTDERFTAEFVNSIEIMDIFFVIGQDTAFECYNCHEVSPAQPGRWTCPSCGVSAVLVG